jgi:hypothetical protein
MPVTRTIIIDGSRHEPKLALIRQSLGVASVIICVNYPGSYDVNHPDNQGGVATWVDPALEGHVIAAQKARCPLSVLQPKLCRRPEGGFSTTHYMHDKLIEMTKGIPFQALWCSMEYWHIWRGTIQTKMTRQNMRAA